MIFRQLFDAESCTYTYIVADAASKKAAVIDPVLEMVERDAEILQQLGLDVMYLVETHVHADHITGGGQLKQKLGGQFVAGKASDLSCADLLIDDNESIALGDLTLTALATPGHTDGCTCWKMEDRVFTGDTLLIRGCGRTDFQQGSSETLYHSVQKKLFSLPGQTLVFPAHDYKGRTVSTIFEEQEFNPRLGRGSDLESFCKTMEALDLPKPKKIDTAVPSNLRCGAD